MIKNRYGLIFIAAIAAGCGGTQGEGVAQPNSTIQIAPSAIGHPYFGNDIAAINTAGGFEDFVTVTVFNESGSPLRRTQVRLYHLGAGTMANINRVLQTEPYIVNTDDFGNVYLYIYTPAFDTVGALATDFEAFSGSAYQKMTVTMTCTDVNTATTLVCD